MALVVAIVGRTNVGKSTLFNALIGKRKAVVDETPGVTRDRIYGEWKFQGYTVQLIDSAGVPPVEGTILQLIQQTEKAVEEADLIFFVTDAKEGLLPDDEEISRWLHKVGKPVILVVNKVDSHQKWMHSLEFSSLGWEVLIPVSALHKRGLDLLEDAVMPYLNGKKAEELETPRLIFSLAGKRNVGKSTLLNQLAKQERALTSPEPGTTRDVLETEFSYERHIIQVCDMAGLHLKKRFKADIEFYSEVRAKEAIRKSDAVIFLLDAEMGITKDDKKIAQFLWEVKKPFVFAVNKWDLVQEKVKMMEKQFRNHLLESLPRYSFVPVCFISAKTGFQIEHLLDETLKVVENARFRVATPVLNRILLDFRQSVTLPSKGRKRLFLPFITQVDVSPPHFVIIANYPELVNENLLVQWEQFLRRFYPFSGVCLRFTVRKRS